MKIDSSDSFLAKLQTINISTASKTEKKKSGFNKSYGPCTIGEVVVLKKVLAEKEQTEERSFSV